MVCFMGMTNQGGANNLGVIFSFDPANPTTLPRDLFDFDGNAMSYLMEASFRHLTIFVWNDSGWPAYPGLEFQF